MINLSIILPVNNEEKGIESVINRVIRVFENKNILYEIICVENGSIDNSFQKLKKISRKYKQLVVYQSKKGWGNAVLAGIKKARGEYCCYMVSDNQVDLRYALTVFEALIKNRYDMVKVERISRENPVRFLNSWFYNLICLIFFGIGNDINATPKVLKTSLLKKMNLRSENIAIDLELMLKLKKRNLKWLNIPIDSKKRKWGSSTTNIRTVIEMLKYIMMFKFKNTS